MLAWLINATVATSLACGAILLLRKPLQHRLGGEAAFRPWALVPLAALVAAFSFHKPAAVPLPLAGNGSTIGPAILESPHREAFAFDADRWLLGVWAVGLLVLIVRQAWHQRYYVARMGLRLGADGSWRSEGVGAAPALLGVFRPRLVLPLTFESDYSVVEQQLVIAHERMHQSRRDPLALLACAFLRALFWFNPLLHFSASRFRRDMEVACDAAVLRCYPDKRRTYAGALLKTQLAGIPLPVGCLWHQTPPMKERIMLLGLPRPNRRNQWFGVVLIACATTGISGLALAGHDIAAQTATALAKPAPVAGRSYVVELNVSIDGEHVGDPRFVSRAGTTQTIKLSGKSNAIEFRFHVEPQANPSRVMIVGDLLAGEDDHVVSSPRLVAHVGKVATIEATDRAGSHIYRIDALLDDNSGGHSLPALGLSPRPRSGVGNSEGLVELKVLVGSDGQAKQIQVVKSRPLGMFDGRAIAAAKHWHFDQPMRDGKPVEGWVTLPMHFQNPPPE